MATDRPLPTPDGTVSTSGDVPDVDIPSEAREFLAVYGDRSLSEEAWLSALEPYTAPELLASLRGSDRDLLAAAGSTVLEANDEQIVVGKPERAGFSLRIEELETVDEGKIFTVRAIDWIDPPPGARLPLGSDALEQLEVPAQDAVLAVLAQPGGLSDAERMERIRKSLAAPSRAMKLPRAADPSVAVRVGAMHDLALAQEGGKVAVCAVVPYADDGRQDAQWAAVTVTFTRAKDGSWKPDDAWY